MFQQKVLVDQYNDTGPAALDNYELRFGEWRADPGWDYRIVSWAACETGAVVATPPGPAGVIGLWARRADKASMIAGLSLVGNNGEIISAVDPVAAGTSDLGYWLRPSWGVSVVFRAATYPALWQVTVTLDMYRSEKGH